GQPDDGTEATGATAGTAGAEEAGRPDQAAVPLKTVLCYRLPSVAFGGRQRRGWNLRRFYDSVATAPGPQGIGVTLDGKPIRSPAGRKFAVPGAALAEAIAEEWAAVPAKGEIKPEKMPLTRLAMTGLDRAAEQ